MNTIKDMAWQIKKQFISNDPEHKKKFDSFATKLTVFELLFYIPITGLILSIYINFFFLIAGLVNSGLVLVILFFLLLGSFFEYRWIVWFFYPIVLILWLSIPDLLYISINDSEQYSMVSIFTYSYLILLSLNIGRIVILYFLKKSFETGFYDKNRT